MWKVTKLVCVVSGSLALVLLAAVLLVLPSASTATLAAIEPPTTTLAQAGTPQSITGLRVSGNQLVDGDGQPVRLLGVNRSGAQYACIQRTGLFDGPVDDAAIRSIKAWNVNTVRVPLNAHCWLGLRSVRAPYGGANYQAAIADFVQRLNAQGLYVILDLHWNAPAGRVADRQQAMPDRDYAPEFWRQVAAAYKDNSAVIFDLYNEPYPDSERDTTAAWACWRDGGTCPGVPFQAAGMQELVTAVRSTGATNLILVGGVRWASSLSRWLEYRPSDPANNLAASWHTYGDLACVDEACWNSVVARVAEHVPVVATEIGQFDCRHDFIERVMSWLDARGQSYIAWAWAVADCDAEPALITDWDGTPTQTYGQRYRDHLAALGERSDRDEYSDRQHRDGDTDSDQDTDGAT